MSFTGPNVGFEPNPILDGTQTPHRPAHPEDRPAHLPDIRHPIPTVSGRPLGLTGRTASSMTASNPPSPSASEKITFPSGATAMFDRLRLAKYLNCPKDALGDFARKVCGVGEAEQKPSESLNMKSFDASARFTYYSDANGIVQGETIDILKQNRSAPIQLNASRPATPQLKPTAGHAPPHHTTAATGNGAPETVSLVDTASCSWLDVLNPSSLDLQILSQMFGIHPLTTEDILMHEPREKVEFFDQYMFLAIRTFAQDSDAQSFLTPINLYVLVFFQQSFTLSLHSKPVPHIASVLNRVTQLQFNSVDFVMYALFDDVVDSFSPILRVIQYEVDTIDDLVLILTVSEQSDMMRRLRLSMKQVTKVMRLLSPKYEVVKSLSNRAKTRLTPTTLIYLRDIEDHVITLMQSMEIFLQTLSRAHNNYLAQISVELTKSSNEANEIMKSLSGLAGIFIPMTLVTGLWGMNVNVPGQGEGGTAWFWGITSILAFIGVLLWIAARRFNIF